MKDKIKIKISSFVTDILDNDALRFNFTKNGQSNKNALLNKLIPTLVEVRKTRRMQIEKILKNEYNREDRENIYNAVNTIIDRVYFNEEEELNVLDEYIWIRPSKESMVYYDEIRRSETLITAQETPVYIRGLLNEYSLLPQYKRELLVFDKEIDIFTDACVNHHIIHFKDRETNERYKAFAFDYIYGKLGDQINYCVIFDITNRKIKAIPLYNLQDIYPIKQKYKPTDELAERLQIYADNREFDEEISIEENENVF